MTFNGLVDLDYRCLEVGTDEFTINNQPLSEYPWLSQSDNVLQLVITDPDQIDFEGRYLGTHIRGKASQSFELVVCVIHKPSTSFLIKEQVYGEFVRGIYIETEHYEGVYNVELNPYTVTNEPSSCGTLVIEPKYEANGRYNPDGDTGKLQVRADKLLYTFFAPHEYDSTILHVNVGFKFSKTLDTAYDVKFKVIVLDCPMITRDFNSTAITEVIPMAESHTISFSPWDFDN